MEMTARSIRTPLGAPTCQPTGQSGRLRLLTCFTVTFLAFLSLSCTQLEKPEPQPFFAESSPPTVQEFRWSNGKLPKSFDPALASAPPETDVVRALYEGLTETDPASLQEVPGVAESWASSDDLKVWTFKLRKTAKWSNGKPVTANDFVRAWKRLIQLGDKAAHRNLLSNIAGVPRSAQEVQLSTEAAEQLLRSNSNSNTNQVIGSPTQRLGQIPANANSKPSTPGSNTSTGVTAAAGEAPPLGIVAEDDQTLKVTLIRPDKEFPRLVANPIFRPIFSNGEEFIGKELNPTFVTNGPFRLAKVETTGLVLDRSETYWNRENVKLERVQLIATESPEKALTAYRAGELDAITNADFSPLVLKLLSPYEDFRKTTHSALNFYEVNSAKAPFTDRRVRAALSNAIERDRLTEGEMEGQTRPALGFLPYATGNKAKLTQDKERAKDLLDEAGFPEGEGFPVIKLLVNRNDIQQRIARSVAKMWKQTLNVETEVIVKDNSELERMRKAGEFDLVRRGVVFPTSDETANFMAMFEIKPPAASEPPAQPDQERTNGPSAADPTGSAVAPTEVKPGAPAETAILTEDDAIYELHAIPLYFPTSYSLVKPYVTGFEMNSLDAISLSNVTINSNWQPKVR